jgi:hypothetical protein
LLQDPDARTDRHRRPPSRRPAHRRQDGRQLPLDRPGRHGAQTGAAGIDLEPFIHALQVAFAVGFVFSMIGAVVSSMRGVSDVEEELGQAIAA